MFSTFITVALFVLFATRGASADFAINHPTLNQCSPAKISWAPANAPYLMEIVSADDPCGPALQTIENLTSTVYEYTTSLKPGTNVLLYIVDSKGLDAWSSKITIGKGSDTTCAPGASTITASASSTPAANPSTPNSPTPAAPALQSSPSPAGPSPSDGLAGALNAASSGVFTVHRASMPLLSITALAAMLVLTL